MKPKPLASLNHLTVPVVRIVLLLGVVVKSEFGHAAPTDYAIRVMFALTRGRCSGASDWMRSPKQQAKRERARLPPTPRDVSGSWLRRFAARRRRHNTIDRRFTSQPFCGRSAA